jgi:hypothetical protein
MKRSGLGLIGPALLLVLLPMTLSSFATACGCTAPAPAGTPPPVGAAEAASNASKIAGVTGMTTELDDVFNWRQFYRASGGNAVAFVYAVDGTLFEVVLTDQMPGTATPDAGGTAAGGTARSAAEAFMTHTGLSADGLTESIATQNVAGVSAYVLTWKDATGAGSPRFEISVNAAAGAVFAYLDLRLPRQLAAPVVGRTRAIELTIAGLGAPGEQVTAADLTIDFTSGKQISIWDVGLGVPTATQADAFEKGALVQIDVATGSATIVKR